MKLAVQGHAPGRGYRIAEGGYDVYLDGRVIPDVVAVDTCTGVAWVCAHDTQGHIVIDRANDCVVIERRSGSFRVELDPRWANPPSADEE